MAEAHPSAIFAIDKTATKTKTRARLITDLAFANSVRAGQLWIPPRFLTSRLSRHCLHIFCKNEDKRFPSSLRGSGSAIQINGQNFVFLFKHQIIDYSPSQILIFPRGDMRHLVSGSSYFFIEDTSSEFDDLDDICTLGYAVDKYDVLNFERDFFSVVKEAWPNNSKNFFMIYGYPSSLQDVCTEGTAIHGRLVNVTATYAGPSHSRYVHRLHMLRKTQFNPDGMSGGLVFHFGEDDSGYFIGLAGFIIRGGASSEIVHFVEAKAAHLLADKVCRKKPLEQISAA